MENRDHGNDDDCNVIAKDTECTTETAADKQSEAHIHTPAADAEQANAEIRIRNDCNDVVEEFPPVMAVLPSARTAATAPPAPYDSSKSTGAKALEHAPPVESIRLLPGRRKKLKDALAYTIAKTDDGLAPRVENEMLEHALPFEPEGQGPALRQLTAEPLQNPSVVLIANDSQDVAKMIPYAEARSSADLSSHRSSTTAADEESKQNEEAPNSTLADSSADYDILTTERDFYALEAHRVPDYDQDEITVVVDAYPARIKWYRRSSYRMICVIILLFGGILGGVVFLVLSRSGTADSQSPSPPISSPVSSAPTSATTMFFTPEEIACNFLSRTSLTECRATVSFDSSNNTADTVTGSTIPSEIGLLTQLRKLSLWKNNLKGTVPSSLSRLTLLTDLDFSDNQLTGSIPSSLSSLTQLTALSIAKNTLSGSMSPISYLTQLEFLDVFDNLFNGTILSTFANLTKLKYFKLGMNTLTGTIPTFLSTFTELTYLDFTDCDLTGTIPASFSSLTNLKFLTFFNNALTGRIPSSLSSLTKLEYLGFRINSLTGTIPSSVSSLTQLTELSFMNNQLTGTIPSSFSSLKKLEFVNFFDNHLTGTIPSSLCSNETTIIVDCSEVSCDAGCCFDESFSVCS